VTFTDSLTKISGKTVAIDIDGTICTEERTFERPLAKPLPGAIEALRMLKENGNTIILYTARGWEQYKVTKAWLDQNEFVYDQIIMGKPIADVWIDDRARHFKGWSDLDI
jgi:uncharacterized HAD superfamily protein